MASAQLLYNIDTKPKTTNTRKTKSNKKATATSASAVFKTKTNTTIQSTIEEEHHYKKEKLSIFCNKTEVERKQEGEQDNSGNIRKDKEQRKQHATTTANSISNNYTKSKTFKNNNNSSSCERNEKEELELEKTTTNTITKTENSLYVFTKNENDIDTKVVFISQEKPKQQQQQEKQLQLQQQLQIWPGTITEAENCLYDKFMQATETAAATQKSSTTAATSIATQIFHTDDVVVDHGVGGGAQRLQNKFATETKTTTRNITTNIDKRKLCTTNKTRKCYQLQKQQQQLSVPTNIKHINNYNRSRCNSNSRTIQQQKQQPNYYYNNVSLHDYKGIEEFKIHTKQNKNYCNNYSNKNNTKMPISNNQNNKNIILKNILSASGPNANDNCYFQTTKNETTKCCQRNVAKQCCNNYNKTNTNTTTTTIFTIQQKPQQKLQISNDRNQQNQIQQQRNFYNTTTTSITKQQQLQKFATFSSKTTTTNYNKYYNNNTLTKFYRDLQKMSKYFLSLLVIFNMLPLFYAECDQTFVSRIGGPQNGTFSAPLLHNHKNHSRQCLYTFLAGPGQRVEVIFKSFNLRGNPPDGSAVGELPSCVHEYMDIYSEVQSSEPAELINSPFGGRYCGTIPPRQRISMYRAIAISFFTNKNITTPDLFEGTFRFINASEYEIGIPIAGSPCSYTITPSLSINKTGVLISPTYPGAYPKDMSCTYQFLGETNQRVRLEFRDFDLFFGGPHCPFDYVKVYDGPDNSSALIGAYCGQQRNLVLYSSESSLFVHFFTLSRTANTQNRGFKGIYEFSESFVKLDFIRENDGIHMRGSECDQKILSRKESTGFVLSPNYPYPYIPKTVCRYFIYGMQDAQHLERVRLEFTAFNIPRVESKDKDKETNCSDGYLKIYLKGQETADAYDKFDYELCGNETQRVVSEGPRLAMVFSSGELQGRGFKGKYVFETEYKIPGTAAPDGSCSFTYVSASKKRGELNSPRYPSNYPSDTNCSYLFLAEPNEQVTIVFDHFKIKADGNSNVTAGAYGSVICYEDWLEMYVVYRDNNDRFLGRYCGMTAPGPVESPRGAVGLRITLHTDQENVASGFKARYFFETAKSEIGDCGGNFSNEDSGIITSPNYPAGYKAPGRGMASMACNWLMTARPGYKLSIHFEHFSLEGDPTNRGCPAAVLRLWVNVDSDQPPLELCGEKPPIEQWHYISTGQTARISFTTSDKTVGAQGFRIVWTEIQDSGPGPPSIGLLCESTYHFQCEVGYCISDKLRCDGVKNCGPNDDSDELHCITKAQAEDHGVLIITTLLVVSFLICLLCILYHSRRKRRQQLHQMGLHRNAHYDSQTSATGLNSSRRHLQSGGASIAGSLHGINSGNLIIPPAPLPPRAIHQPPHICISGSSLDLGPGNYPGILINGDSLDDSSTTSNDSIGSIPFLNECETDNMGHMIVQQVENV